MLYSQRPQRKSVRSAGTRARVPRSAWDVAWDGGQPLSPPRLARSRSRTEPDRDQVLQLFYFTQYSIVVAKKVNSQSVIGQKRVVSLDWMAHGTTDGMWDIGIGLVAEALS